MEYFQVKCLAAQLAGQENHCKVEVWVPVAKVSQVYEISFLFREYRVAELEVSVDCGICIRSGLDESGYPVLLGRCVEIVLRQEVQVFVLHVLKQ